MCRSLHRAAGNATPTQPDDILPRRIPAPGFSGRNSSRLIAGRSRAPPAVFGRSRIPLIIRETAFGRGRAVSVDRIQPLYAALATDEQRNRLILDDVATALAERRSPIVLTERKDRLEFLAASLRGVARHVVVLRGGMTSTERRGASATLAGIPDTDSRLIVATGRYIGEGFDDARLDTLFLAMPVSWKDTLVQDAGRLHRLHPGKAEVRIYDYVDREVPMLAQMFQKRLRGYRDRRRPRSCSATREDVDADAEPLESINTPAVTE
jgi:superfamily II DNA or RNA helicase